MMTGMTRFLTSDEVEARKEQITKFFNEYVDLCKKYNCVLIEEGWWANSIEEFISNVIPENTQLNGNETAEKFRKELLNGTEYYFGQLECHCERFFDKNGIELKDGDIVFGKYDIPYKVEKRKFCWTCHQLKNFTDGYCHEFGCKDIEKIDPKDYPEVEKLMKEIEDKR